MDNTALSRAIFDQDIEKVKRLLASGNCSVTGADWVDFPPLLLCICSGVTSDWNVDNHKCTILETLLAYGAEVNAPDTSNAPWYRETAAMAAAERGFPTCLRTLVEAGADLNITSRDGHTALTKATYQGHDACVKFLTENKPVTTLNMKNKEWRSALMLAASCAGENYFLCVQYLVEAGADLEARDDRGFTALLFALEGRAIKTFTYLLKHGALVNIVPNFGQTPLSVVQRYFTSLDLVKLAMSGLDPTLSYRDRYCLHIAISKEHHASVRALVKCGMPPLDLDCKPYLPRGSLARLFDGYTFPPMSPLALAILHSDPDTAKYLIANRFFTPFDIVKLPWDSDIRRVVTETRQYPVQLNRVQQCLDILVFLSRGPQSLFSLSLTVASSALSQDLSRGLELGRNNYLCKPTFKEKVNSLAIYPALKRALLHQTRASGTCCYSWREIPLGEDVVFPDCKCTYCAIQDI